MQPIILALLTVISAQAIPVEPYLGQLESHHKSLTWKHFVDILMGREARSGDLTVTVTDPEGRPLAGASVLVGQAEGNPFAGNKALTDANGVASFTDESLRGGKTFPVTASLDGRTTVTLLQNAGNTVAMTMMKKPDERGFGFMRGKINGIPQQGAGTLEMGFFIPAARTESLLNFDVQSFVSSYTVKINIYGDRDIPGNVVLPQQTKFWNIVPVTLNKPDFIMPLQAGLTTHMYGISGGIPIAAAVSAIQKKDFLEVLNLASLTNVGWTRDRITVHGNENFDINVNHVVDPGKITTQVAGVPAHTDLVAVSLIDPSGDKGDFVAMDIKTLKSENMQNGGGTLRLGQVRSRDAASNTHMFAALFDKTQIQNSQSRWVVGSVRPVSRSNSVQFPKFMNPIRFTSIGQANREFRFTSPTNGALAPDMMIVNIVSEKNNAETKGTTRTVLWSAVVPGGTDHIVLPDLGRPVLPAPDTSKGEKFHWEVIGLHSNTNRKAGEFNLQESLRNLQDVSTLQQAF